MKDDIINRQAAINLIEAGRLTKLIDAETAINSLKALPPAQPKPQWIPCSERMPDVAQRVLLSGHGVVIVGMLHSSGKYSLEPTGISCVYSKEDIEAWMPLPEPYQSEAKRRTNGKTT